MKKIIITLLSLGLFSQQASAVTVFGEVFAGSADSAVFGGNVAVGEYFQNNSNVFNDSPANALLVEQAITDDSAATAVLGRFAGATVDLGFSQAVLTDNGTGDDLKLFFVGNNGHMGTITIEGITNPFDLTAGGPFSPPALPNPLPEGFTGNFAGPDWPNDPIVALGIDLDASSWSGLSGDPISQISIMLGDGGDTNSAVLSFAGAYSVVPVPAAVWLFGSGLLGLAGIARKRA